ncbi:glycosyltransferase [Saccharothrix sp. S26]|uniref:glycosyltransferase n=1 Tax=Saccharothrix sp. S26 TaxID=2907215 RepID=UPI001F307BB2|nr:glycosyltransferase [Saccharothrix sp. S26]MCE7001087.1 glycosyltransferase [Saccharothrix sp. S26]
MALPPIDPALGIELVAERTVRRRTAAVSVVVPAHDEEATIAEVVSESARGLAALGVPGQVVVSASGCTDRTAEVARSAGALVVEAGIGKGAAVVAGVKAADGDVICLVDGDVRYFGDPPLVPLLVGPILDGIADATVTDLYWRPLYPQLWLCGFFAPLAGALLPELLPKVGSTPWSGQRAAVRELWPDVLPEGFTSDLALLLHWNEHAVRLRPVLADDWTNPQRPKPELMAQEFELLVAHAVERGRVARDAVPSLGEWFESAHRLMAGYRPGEHDPREFEADLLDRSLAELRARLHSV